MATVMAGDLGASATLDAKIRVAVNSSGGSPADVTGTDSNKQAVINLDTEKLAGSAYTHFELSMTVGTATSDAGAIVHGFDPRYAPASDNDSTAVDSIASA